MDQFLTFSKWLGVSIKGWDIQYRIHATYRMFQRNIEESEILFILEKGSIIENYEEDLPFPSVLVNGMTNSNRPLHIVVGIDKNAKRLYIITTYEPEQQFWMENYSRRIKS